MSYLLRVGLYIGDSYMRGISKRKAQFDAKLSRVAPWTVHDLRRTARSLMSRAWFAPNAPAKKPRSCPKRCVGNPRRHEYRTEKAKRVEGAADEAIGALD